MVSTRTPVRSPSLREHVPADDDRTVVVPGADGAVVRVDGAARRPIWPWVAGSALALLVVAAAALPGAPPRPTAVVERSVPETPVTIVRDPWSWLTRPVPSSARSLSITLPGGTDLFELIALGSSVEHLTGVGAIADGVRVGQVLGDHAVAVEPSGAIGPPVVLFVTDPLVAGSLVPGQLITFEGTLMPAPPDLSEMAGPEAAAIAGSSGVYVSAVPATIGPVPPVT
jgi:hypothetical protein